MDPGLLQRELATRLGTSVCNVVKWETNRACPSFRVLTRILRFLGYCPVRPADTTLGQRIRAGRRILGLSQAELAGRLGVHPATVASWEQARHQPMPGHRQRLATVIQPGLPQNGRR